ncbi:MAG: hypothetical protein EOM76_10380 [Sphingobacteriia bacterium]|nr:hypothetical protein [Sphingobacteriia bacterium]
MEYTLQIDLEVNDDLSMGNQFEFYMKKSVADEYEQILPVQVSWGSSNSLNGQQLLNNTELTDTRRSKMIHNLVASRGWAFTLTLLFDDTKPIIVDLFKETFLIKDTMNTPFSLSVKYKKKTMVANTPTFAYANNLAFEYDLIPSDSMTEIVYGDKIIFTVGFAPSWNEVE